MSNITTLNSTKPYMVIEGSSQSIESFEKKVATALENGYTLAGELVTSSGQTNEVKFFQPVIFLEIDDEDEYEDEDEDEYEEEDEI